VAQSRPGQKKCQPSAVAPGWHHSSQGDLFRDTLCCRGIDFGASGADDLIGCTEDLLGALFGYGFGIKTASTADPILNVTSAKVGPLKPQRLATQKRH